MTHKKVQVKFLFGFLSYIDIYKSGDGFSIPVMNKLMDTGVVGANMGFAKLPKPICGGVERGDEDLV